MAVTNQLNKSNRDAETEREKVLTTLGLDLAVTKGLNKSKIDAERERQKVLSAIELVFAVRLDEIQLNKQLCRYLRKQLGKMRNAVEFLNEALGTVLVPDIYRSACEELHLVVKRVENLQQRCVCKTLPWLDAAITLANVKEEVLELLLDLSWWTHMLKIATNSSGMGGSGVTQKVETAVMQLEALFEKLRKEGSSLQKASQADEEYLVSRLQGVLEEKRTPNGERSTPVTHHREYILATYLLFRIKGDPIAPDVGPQLKHNVWVKHLGSGSSGAVNEVTWLNQNCALKSFIAGSDEKEVTLLKVCSHPHIVQYFWHWQGGYKCHMMMESMPENLSTHLNRRDDTPFPLHVAIDIMLQIAKAMQYLHSKRPQKIVHRDLKPSNILLKPLPESSDGYIQVKLADFGESKFYNKTATSSPQTRMVGTSVYAAPEVFTQEVVLDNNNPKFPSKADVWSFAMVCSEILTGQQPFIDQKRDGLHDRIKKFGIRPQLPNDCPYDLRFCITQCWDLDPKRRPKFIDVYKMLNVAKARSLGILHFDTFKHLFSPNQHLLSKSLKLARLEANVPLISENLKVQGMPKLFSYKQLKSATNDFHDDNKLGEARCGAVFKGSFLDGMEVAIKRHCEHHELQWFLKEVMLMAAIQNPHLVMLLGCCFRGNDHILVYELPPNGCLCQALSDQQHVRKLDWSTRFKIILGIAQGLEYLHERVYVAPESEGDGELTEKIDVFSFGVVVLELISNWGLSNGRQLFTEEQGQRLQEILEKILKKKEMDKLLKKEMTMQNGLNFFRQLNELIQQIRLPFNFPEHSQLDTVFKAACLCVQLEPTNRPKMTDVVAMLR
ncbi:hypothetical protein CY35_04G037500 [Sphagnum magellanicum]|nr:hypothetical protein CY35_04G037500 [Sphagnum magellanicum]